MKKYIILSLLLFCLALAFVGFYYYKNKDSLEIKKLTNIKLNASLIDFTYKMLPALYSGLYQLNYEIGVIDEEIKRLTEIENEFPKQKQIVSAEKTIWGKTQKNLEAALSKLSKSIEDVYVLYIVNTEKGKNKIKEKKDDLIKFANDTLDQSKQLTKKIQKEKKGFFKKIKEKIFKK